MTTLENSATCFVLVSVVALLAYRWTMIAEQDRITVARQKAVMANYKSPVERTDAQRLDWLTAHPKQAPWTKYGTDPRREIDFAMDQEEEATK